MKTLWFVAAMLLATDVNGRVQMLGNVSCADWVKDPASLQRSYEIWVAGFLSGAAVFTGKNALTTIRENSISAWLDQYCRVNPLTNLGEAAADMFEELVRRNAQQR